MARIDIEAYALIREYGGVFVRVTKHAHLYRLPNGEFVGFSRSTGDKKAIKALRATLRRKASRAKK